MSLIKFMAFGLIGTAVLSLIVFSVFGAEAAFGSGLIVGLVTQHGALLAASMGFPHYGFWR